MSILSTRTCARHWKHHVNAMLMCTCGEVWRWGFGAVLFLAQLSELGSLKVAKSGVQAVYSMSSTGVVTISFFMEERGEDNT